MKSLIKKELIKLLLIVPLLLISFTINAQDTSSYEKAKAEIEEEFGMFPKMFEIFPDHALAGAWENFKMLNSPESKIPAKYRELLQLAVASQIPCNYCIYYHSAAAKAYGATEEEIQEAVAQGAQTRHWSMILQGNQVDFEEFKAEFNAMMKHMASKSK
ncbi:carboxymuconolactone decarboxylase family protein [Gramella jeungdoensis]|uniref:Carboxymuconolactone decarboxylase family protein n=1 Tax=Gramella jeungdoensis TaxID=708091 RepID=A0ABT0Z1Q6_9FLAO|nr:carboxymuconolactone decarboxylase family protein [Gramella jeungdoensis]MCM8569320.1 carboxymuconolactone decarboxylase family protein [Gramella jeungdoensis]